MRGFFRFPMNAKEFLHFRRKLDKTQEQMAQLLGTSVRSVHSYEQGWRFVPAHVERQVLFLAAKRLGDIQKPEACWIIKNCPPERKERCPAWEFQCGDLCWFINGTICAGRVQSNWEKKMRLCRKCVVLKALKSF